MDEASVISRAVEVLRSGGLVALPTETVYGLAADAENELAVRRIFAVKGRPSSHPLIVHLPNVPAVEGWAREFPPEAEVLAKAFWPGPLTLVLPRGRRALDAVTGGQDTVALRIPAHPLTRQILVQFGRGVAAPSANRFGGVSPTTAEHVFNDLGVDVDLVVDGGPCVVGVESTIVDLSSGPPVILRPGGVAREALEKALGRPVPLVDKSRVRVPGTQNSHYAPHAGVVLVEPHELWGKAQELAESGKKVAAFCPPDMPCPPGVGALEVPADPKVYARVLYATLREADVQGYEVVVVALPPAEGLGLALCDRLTRAAAPRPHHPG